MERLELIRPFDRCFETTIGEHDGSKRLLRLEGAGTLNATNL